MILCQLHPYYFWHKNILTWIMYCHVVTAKSYYIFWKNLFKLIFFSLLRLSSKRKKHYPFPPPSISLCHSFKSFHWLLLIHLGFNILDFKATIHTPGYLLLIISRPIPKPSAFALSSFAFPWELLFPAWRLNRFLEKLSYQDCTKCYNSVKMSKGNQLCSPLEVLEFEILLPFHPVLLTSKVKFKCDHLISIYFELIYLLWQSFYTVKITPP